MLWQLIGAVLVTLYQILIGIVLGVVQGVSEWLPISSKTQILIVSHYLLGLNYSQAYTFGLFMEIGTIFASVIYFRKELIVLIKVLSGKGTAIEKKLFSFVFATTVITGIIAVPLYKFADNLASYNIGLPMIILGMILFADAAIIKYSRSKYTNDKNRKMLGSMSIKDYALVGIAQGIAALPGVSRSGTTTSILLLENVEANEAFRLSFIDMIFATTGAVGVTLLFNYKTQVLPVINQISPIGIAVAIIVATAISLVFIGFLLNIAKKSKIIYLTMALGAIALISGIIITLFPVLNV